MMRETFCRNDLEASELTTPDNERRTYAQALHFGCWIISPCCVCQDGSDLLFQQNSGVACDVHPYPDAAERIHWLRRANVHSGSGLADSRQSDAARIVLFRSSR